MDDARLDRHVLSVSPQQPYFEREPDAVSGARVGNELLADLVRAHPQRFNTFGAVPLLHIDRALGEIDCCLDVLEMAGLTVNSSILGKSLANPAFAPLFPELDRRRPCPFVHPAGAGFGELTSMFGVTWLVGRRSKIRLLPAASSVRA